MKLSEATDTETGAGAAPVAAPDKRGRVLGLITLALAVPAFLAPLSRAAAPAGWGRCWCWRP